MGRAYIILETNLKKYGSHGYLGGKKSYEALYSKIIDLSLLKHIKQNLYNITTTYNYLILHWQIPQNRSTELARKDYTHYIIIMILKNLEVGKTKNTNVLGNISSQSSYLCLSMIHITIRYTRQVILNSLLSLFIRNKHYFIWIISTRNINKIHWLTWGALKNNCNASS